MADAELPEEFVRIANHLNDVNDRLEKAKHELNTLKKTLEADLLRIIKSLPRGDRRRTIWRMFWTTRHVAQPLRKAFYKSGLRHPFPSAKKTFRLPCIHGCGAVVKIQATSWTNLDETTRGRRRTAPICTACSAAINEKLRREDDELEEWYRQRCQAERDRLNHLRSLPYAEYLKTDHWQSVRKRALRRSDYRCQLCNRSTVLHVHHRTYERLGCEDWNDVIALCKECHEHHHDVTPHHGGDE